MTAKASASGRGDERVAQIGFFRGLFRRVEIGALIGAVVVWLFFAIITPQNWVSITGVARILDPASTLGIMAIAVALLMIGGEYDLSAGVMTGTTGLVAGLLATQLGLNLWLAALVALVFALAVGYINGILRVKTKLPSFIVTLATFFVLRGANVGVTRLVTDQVLVSGIDQVPGFASARAFFSTGITLFGVEFRSSIIWWIVLRTMIGRLGRRSRTAPVPRCLGSAPRHWATWLPIGLPPRRRPAVLLFSRRPPAILIPTAMSTTPTWPSGKAGSVHSRVPSSSMATPIPMGMVW